jgi:hypothetical protein
MKSAEVYSVRAPTSRSFVWKWRSPGDKKTSTMSFASYHDCLADAQKSGYQVAPLGPR